MTTPSMHTHLLAMLLRLAVATTIVAMATTAADPAQPGTTAAAAVTLPGCSERCGDVILPYPFGMKDGCFLPGFQIICNDTDHPPRAFLSSDLSGGKKEGHNILVENLYYSIDEDSMPYHPVSNSSSPVELTSVTVSEGKATVLVSFTSDCGMNKTYHSVRRQTIYLGKTSPFRLSSTDNELVGIGSNVTANLSPGPICQSVLIRDFIVPVNGSCSGQGCCQARLWPDCSYSKVSIQQTAGNPNGVSCSYAMIVDKSRYNFSSSDLHGDDFLKANIVRGVPLVVDFAIRDSSCPDASKPALKGYACASANSICVGRSNFSVGYFCSCANGYEGNPYIQGGCRDINECERPQSYICHGKCKNKLGGYECRCPAGTRGNATEAKCTELFPLPAKVSVGAIGVLFVIALLVFLILLRREKRKMRDFFNKNGGTALENAKTIKIYKKEELKPILRSNNFIGKGNFGEVYKGFLDNQLVAVKKPIINGNVAHNEQFANEVIIQSQVIHKNIVRLIGCCLEVDIPMLVYEFLSNGSLEEILHGSSNNVPLSLDRRLVIAAEAAEGLSYLHSKTNNKILHGDVKPANILLDDNYVPKLSDFGISRLIVIDKQHTNSVIGDLNYMDPVYLQKGILTDKSDVYSFGIVLLELISRKKASYSSDKSLVGIFLDPNVRQKRELYDKDIVEPDDLDIIDSILAIAVECLNLEVDQRPEMTDVAERLLMLKRSRNTYTDSQSVHLL